MVSVVAGVIFNSENKILITQRPRNKSYPLQWEFPGGKIEAGESREAALEREIWEELSVKIVDITYFTQTEYHYPELSVELYFYKAKWVDHQEIKLNEHHQFEWVKMEELSGFPFLEADREVLSQIIGQGGLFFK